MRTYPHIAVAVAVAVAIAGSACSDDTDTNPSPDSGSPPADQGAQTGPYCNPISTDNCLLPWPSSFYLKKDTTTQTGWKMAYDKEAMPSNRDGLGVDPARYNLSDGFPVASQPLVWLSEGFSSTTLPDMDSIADSTSDKSFIWILDMTTGEKMPLWAELDENGAADENKPLIIRPSRVFKFNTRYVIVLRKGLKDRAGKLMAPPAPFKEVLDGATITDATLKAEATRLAPVLTFLTGKGIKKTDLVLAWDFHTASKEFVRSNLINMVKEARAKLPATGPKFTITKTEETPTDTNLLRYITGKFTVPSYLLSDADDAILKLDAKGKPVYRGDQEFTFRVNIPRCATTATTPLPILYYGMGLFSAPLEDMNSSFDRKFPNDLCMITASTAWIGLSFPDLALIISKVITENFANLPVVTDRLQQAHVNFHTLVKLMQGDLLKHKSLQYNGKPISDGKERYYVGISNGGIQGVATAALEPDISRYIFNVSGGMWSLMMQRSSNFASLALLLKARYPSLTDRSILISLSQHLWDHTDPASFADLLITAPDTTQPKKYILFQESRHDDQVPNISTRSVARSMGIDQLTPNVKPVTGLSQKAGPLDSAYMQWDLKVKYVPTKKNTPAIKPPNSESAHDKLRHLATCLTSWKEFLKPAGKVNNPCNGACDPD